MTDRGRVDGQTHRGRACGRRHTACGPPPAPPSRRDPVDGAGQVTRPRCAPGGRLGRLEPARARDPRLGSGRTRVDGDRLASGAPTSSPGPRGPGVKVTSAAVPRHRRSAAGYRTAAPARADRGRPRPWPDGPPARRAAAHALPDVSSTPIGRQTGCRLRASHTSEPTRVARAFTGSPCGDVNAARRPGQHGAAAARPIPTRSPRRARPAGRGRSGLRSPAPAVPNTR